MTSKGAKAAGVALPPQREVAQALGDEAACTGSHSNAMQRLEELLKDAGYSAHLKRDNVRLSAFDPEYNVTFRLQINLSRSGYKQGPPAPGQPANPLAWENVESAWKPLLRAYELELAGTEYFAHPTPFPLCGGHFVVNVRREEPMRMGGAALREMADFLAGAHGWLAASNSDVEWAGASVLCHHHFQAFRSLSLPVECASNRSTVEICGVACSVLEWPAPVLRVQGPMARALAHAERIVSNWKQTDPGCSTCNILMRSVGDAGTITIFLRHPAFRTPQSLRTIKSEGVGIIEMAGEIIVPPREGKPLSEDEAFFGKRLTRIAKGIIGGNGPLVGQEEMRAIQGGSSVNWTPPGDSND